MSVDGDRYTVGRWSSRWAVFDSADDHRHSTHDTEAAARAACAKANLNRRKKTTVTTPAPSVWDDPAITARPGDMDKIERDRFERPLILQPDGKKKSYRRTTTFVGCLEDTYKLGQWQQRHVAYGLARRPDLLMGVQSHLPGADGTEQDKDAVNALCEQAREAAAASGKATIGTALHRIVERLDSGEEYPLPDLVRADVEAYQRATDGLTWLHIERMTVADDLQVAGTPDRVFEYQGKRYIGDLKTGGLDFGLSKIEMQLAVYSRSQLYDIRTGTRTDLNVEQNRAAVFHLPAGSGECRLLWVDIRAGWEDVQLALKVWKQRGRRPRPVPFTVERVDVLASLIGAAPTAEQLTDLYRQHKGEWTDAHTELARQRKAALSAAA